MYSVLNINDGNDILARLLQIYIRLWTLSVYEHIGKSVTWMFDKN